MRHPTQGFRLRACQALLAMMLCGACHAAPIPDRTLRKMRIEVAYYVARHMVPDQICLRMRRKYAYNIYGRSVFGDTGTDILAAVGSGVHITFLATIGRVPYCGSARPCPG